MKPKEVKEESPHPQAEKREVYLGDFTEEVYETIEYETKRLGDRNDKNEYPVFADRWEVNRHPEAQKNEVLLGHFSEERFSSLAWNSKRAGALTEAGVRPVFVARNEYLAMVGYIRINRDAPDRIRPPRY